MSVVTQLRRGGAGGELTVSSAHASVLATFEVLIILLYITVETALGHLDGLS